MGSPGLLPARRERPIPYGAISDLQLSKLLSENTAHMLTNPCEADEIEARQELFRFLEGRDARAAFASFQELLKELVRARSLYTHAAGEVEKLFTLTALEERCASVCRRIPALAGCRLTDALAAYWTDEAHLSAIARMEASVSRAKDALASVSRFDMSFYYKSWVTPDRGSVSYAETVRRCASALGFDVGEMRMRTHPGGITIGPATDAPLAALFGEKLSIARSALVPYRELELDALTRLLPEVSFCIEISELADRARALGIPVCYPRVSDTRKYTARDAYDIMLLYKNVTRIVPNDVDFTEEEPFAFILGANGGGKTTYLRCVGANLVLFLSGAPIFARDAEIYPFLGIRTHFPVDERLLEGGRLEDEARRVSAMLSLAEKDSFFLFNETYSGTNDVKGRELTEETGAQMTDRAIFGVFVTHFHELLESDKSFGFLEAVVDGDENERTYKIVRQKSRRGSFARDILKKYGLDRESLEKRGGGQTD